MSNHKSLVSQHLENIKSDALEKFQDIIKTYVHGRHGIYALYRRNSLYYVGLASNLRNRLRSHLKDRHRKLWDRFSVYLTDDDDHVKELESLILRIVGTKGNMNRGKFASSENLGERLKRDIYAKVRQQIGDILGARPRLTVDARRRGGMGRRRGKAPLPLAGVFPKTISVRKQYKEKLYRAKLRRDGRIVYDGHLYDSPSRAASIVAGHPVNGWTFWNYETKPRTWVPLQRLRK